MNINMRRCACFISWHSNGGKAGIQPPVCVYLMVARNRRAWLKKQRYHILILVCRETQDDHKNKHQGWPDSRFYTCISQRVSVLPSIALKTLSKITLNFFLLMSIGCDRSWIGKPREREIYAPPPRMSLLISCLLRSTEASAHGNCAH